MPPDSPSRARMLGWALRFGLFVLGLAFLHLVSGHPPVHPDTDRDLLLARQCTQFDLCVTAGPVSSFHRLLHGALWIHVLAATRALGVGIGGARFAVSIAHALAACLVYEAARVLTAVRVPMIAWVLYLWLSAVAAEAPVFWNPSIVPLPIALFACAMLVAVRRRRDAGFVVASIALALADSHVTSTAILPWIVFVVVATARRPVVTSVAALVAFVVVATAVSFETSATHLQRLAPHAHVAVGGLALVVIASALARRRARSLSSSRTTASLLASLPLYLGAGMGLATVMTGHPVSPRYFAGAVPFACLAGAWLFDVVIGRIASRVPHRPDVARWAARAVVALVVWVALDARAVAREWTLEDVETIAAVSFRSFESFESLARRIRGPDAYALVRALGAFEPDRSQPLSAEPTSHPELLVLRVRAEDLPSDAASSWTVLPLAEGHACVMRPRASRLDTTQVTLCRREGAGEPTCMTTSTATWRDPDRTGELLGRFVPTLDGVIDTFGDPSLARGQGVWTVSFPVRASEPRAHLVTNEDGHFFVRASPSVEGFDLAIDTADRVEMIETDTSAREHSFHGWLPDYAEVGGDEPALLSLVRRSVQERR